MPSKRVTSPSVLVVVLVALFTSITGCTSGDADIDQVWDLSNKTATAVTRSGEATPTPVQEGAPVPASIVSPITATFYEQTTEYRVTLGSPVDPGKWNEQQDDLCGSSQVDSDGYRLTWKHPHPPCDETTNHAEQEITFTVEVPGYHTSETVLCKYQGSEAGIGDPCTWKP